VSAAWVVVGVTVVGGLAAALQAQFMGEMNARVGTLESVFITYGLGALVIGVIMAAARGGDLSSWRALPPYVFLAGVFGLVIVGSVSFGVGRVGVVQALVTFTAAQFAFSALIDHYGWFGAEVRAFDVSRMAGVALLVAGSWLVVR